MEGPLASSTAQQKLSMLSEMHVRFFSVTDFKKTPTKSSLRGWSLIWHTVSEG